MKSFSQYMFDFERFGLSPSKLFSHLNGTSARAPRVLTISMPKVVPICYSAY